MPGIRLNTYWDSVGPVRALCPRTWHLNRSSSRTIKRRVAVQKLFQYTPGLSIQMKGRLPDALRESSRLQFFADVPWGRMLQILFVPR